ncbi:MAG: PAS domain-containing protein [Rhodospirillaceae bacterium]|nr:PAS domain-containing protein [Rhodospirillaceae bacterium]
MNHFIVPTLISAAPRTCVALGTAAFDTAIAANEQANLRSFFEYWKSKRTDERPPLRAAIDPTEIPALLPNVLLIEVVGDPAYDFHYRLLGTAIVAIDGIDYSGSMLSQMVPRTDAYHLIWEHHLKAAAGAIELRYDSLRWCRDNSREHVDYLILLLPLRRNNSIDVLFGYIHYVMDEASLGWSRI